MVLDWEEDFLVYKACVLYQPGAGEDVARPITRRCGVFDYLIEFIYHTKW